MNRVIHFEIHCDNPERAAKFYTDVFGWKVNRWDGGGEPYWLAETGDASQPGINGGLMKRRDPSGAVYNTLAVDSIDEHTKKIVDNGGVQVVPKMLFPTAGYLAYFKDTEGNIFGIWENLKQ